MLLCSLASTALPRGPSGSSRRSLTSYPTHASMVGLRMLSTNEVYIETVESESYLKGFSKLVTLKND